MPSRESNKTSRGVVLDKICRLFFPPRRYPPAKLNKYAGRNLGCKGIGVPGGQKFQSAGEKLHTGRQPEKLGLAKEIGLLNEPCGLRSRVRWARSVSCTRR